MQLLYQWLDRESHCLQTIELPLHLLAIGSVKLSQSLSATPAKPRVAVKVEGTVMCAHCTCMAGLGEACV